MSRVKSRKREPLPVIRTWDDPILTQVCEPVEKGEDVLPILRGMCQYIRHTKICIGLAAPQVGVSKRIIVISPNGFFKTMLNPIITAKAGDIITAREGCMSYPGRFVPIERYEEITVSYWDTNYDLTVNELYTGTPARIIQHEIDHLNGICQVGIDIGEQSKDDTPATEGH